MKKRCLFLVVVGTGCGLYADDTVLGDGQMPSPIRTLPTEQQEVSILKKKKGPRKGVRFDDDFRTTIFTENTPEQDVVDNPITDELKTSAKVSTQEASMPDEQSTLTIEQQFDALKTSELWKQIEAGSAVTQEEESEFALKLVGVYNSARAAGNIEMVSDIEGYASRTPQGSKIQEIIANSYINNLKRNATFFSEGGYPTIFDHLIEYPFLVKSFNKSDVGFVGVSSEIKGLYEAAGMVIAIQNTGIVPLNSEELQKTYKEYVASEVLGNKNEKLVEFLKERILATTSASTDPEVKKLAATLNIQTDVKQPGLLSRIGGSLLDGLGRIASAFTRNPNRDYFSASYLKQVATDATARDHANQYLTEYYNVQIVALKDKLFSRDGSLTYKAENLLDDLTSNVLKNYPEVYMATMNTLLENCSAIKPFSKTLQRLENIQNYERKVLSTNRVLDTPLQKRSFTKWLRGLKNRFLPQRTSDIQDALQRDANTVIADTVLADALASNDTQNMKSVIVNGVLTRECKDLLSDQIDQFVKDFYFKQVFRSPMAASIANTLREIINFPEKLQAELHDHFNITVNADSLKILEKALVSYAYQSLINNPELNVQKYRVLTEAWSLAMVDKQPRLNKDKMLGVKFDDEVDNPLLNDNTPEKPAHQEGSTLTKDNRTFGETNQPRDSDMHKHPADSDNEQEREIQEKQQEQGQKEPVDTLEIGEEPGISEV